MNERLFFLAYKIPYLAIGAAIVSISLFLMLFMVGCVKTATAPSQTTHASNSTYYSSSSMAFVAGLDEAAHAIGHELGKTAQVAGGGLGYVGSIAIGSGKLIANTGQAIASGIGKGAMAIVHTTAQVFIFVLRIPANVFGLMSRNPVTGSIISPAEHSHNNDVPIIDPNDPALLSAQQALPAMEPEKQLLNLGGVQEITWPIHGAITTYFGEKGRYYHPVHTGIDISDGKRAGTTPIKAYRSGTVIAAGRDGGLGNRVIVDHGNGVTSVYGHMSSISVQAGQVVTTQTTLGFEGSTGVSTGTHLHFEIRVNGQAADPLLFITGRP